MNALNRQLLRICSEPFRLFFPLGFLASAIGVMLWPAVFRGWINYYPLEAHARWMILGFGGSMIVGFLGTAAPRMLSSPSFYRWEFLVYLALSLSMMTALFFNRIAIADLLIGTWFLGLLASLGSRFFLARSDVPPPGLPLAVLGICGAAIAGIIFGLGIPTNAFFYLFLRLLYFQGFLWLPILGVAPFLLPRFFGKTSLHDFEESRSLPAGWLRPFFQSLFAAVLLIGSFALEASGYIAAGHILRAVTVGLYLAMTVPGLFSWSRTNGLGLALRWVIPCAVGGWLLVAWFPHLRNGMLHLMFIGSAGLLLLSVATRVILGHSDRQDRLKSPMLWCHALWFMVLFTAATRLTSEFILKVRITHFYYAAALWIVILIFWAWKLRREVRAPLYQKL